MTKIKNRFTDIVIVKIEADSLRDADLLCVGDMKFIRTLQFERWAIGYTCDTLQIGCQRHPIDKWRKWDTEAGRKWVDSMEMGVSLVWADKYLALVLQIVDATNSETHDD